MGRKIVPVLILLLIVCGIFFMYPETNFMAEGSNYQPLFRIMESAGAQVTNAELHYWASLPQKDFREGSILQELENLADEFTVKLGGFTEELPAECYQASGIGEKGVNLLVQRDGLLSNGSKMKLFLQPLEGEGGQSIHIVLNITGDEPHNLAKLAGRLPSLLDGRACNSTLSFCLIGEIAGAMQPAGMDEFARGLIQDIGGKWGQCIRDGQMISVTGYHPRLGDCFRAGGDSLNLNIALRGDDLPGRTRIWAGTPLISCWY